MGVSQSSRGDRDMKDVLKFFEEELNKWTTLSKALKDAWEKGDDRSWVSGYLYKEMVETESRWVNIKNFKRESVENGQSGRLKYPEHEDNIPECCQKMLKQKSAEIDQLQKNNETLLQKKQAAETKYNDLKKIVEETQQKENQSAGNDKGAQAGITGKEQSDQIEVVQQNTKRFEEGKPGRVEYPEHETNIPEFCQAMLKHKSAEINRLKKNNETLHQKQQATEFQVKKLQKTVEELQQKDKQSTGNDKNGKAGTAREESSDQLENVQQDAKVNVQTLKGHRSVANNMPKDGDGEKIHEMEEEYRKGASELKTLKDKFEKDNRDLEERIVKLQKENKDLKARFEETNKRDFGDAEQRRQQAVKHNEDKQQQSNDQKKQQLQIQMKGKEEKSKRELLDMQEENQMLYVKNESLVSVVKKLDKEKNTFEHELCEVRKEKDALLLRLSKFAGDRLTENNPAIADLSDPNRPTKLAEFYSELYDNEWTDAFEALKGAGYEDRVAVETLKLTFLNTMQYCESKANHLMQKSTDAVNFLFGETGRTSPEMKVPSHATMPQKQAKEMGVLFREKSSIEDVKFQQRWMPVGRRNARDGKSSSEKSKTEENTKKDVVSKLNLLRKEMAIHMIPIVQKAYMETNWSKEYIQELKPFIMNCIFMSWMMLVQSPPMSLHKLPGDKEINFNKNFYKEYTCSGPLISYVVWPALLLNEGGPLLCKGVAEGKQPSK